MTASPKRQAFVDLQAGDYGYFKVIDHATEEVNLALTRFASWHSGENIIFFAIFPEIVRQSWIVEVAVKNPDFES